MIDHNKLLRAGSEEMNSMKENVFWIEHLNDFGMHIIWE